MVFNTWVPVHRPALLQAAADDRRCPRDAVIPVTERPRLPSLARAADGLVESRRPSRCCRVSATPRRRKQHYRDAEIAFTAADVSLRSEGWVSRALRLEARKPPAFAFDMLDIRESDPMGPYRGEKLAAVQVHHGGASC